MRDFRLLSAIAGAAALLATACGGGSSPSASTPVVDAGEDQVVAKRALVTLSASANAEPSATQFAWQQVSGSAVVLSSTAARAPTFEAPAESGVVTFSVVATVAGRASAPDTVSVRIVNAAPAAAAGADLVAETRSWVTLDARGSSDPDGDPLAFTWYQTGGPDVALAPGPAGTVRFLGPSEPAVLTFEVVVGDGEASAADVVQVTVARPPVTPVAHAGPDQIVSRRARVTLLGSSTGPPDTTYAWEQVGGAPVALSAPTGESSTFLAPDASGVLVFALVATAGGRASAPDLVEVRVVNSAPAASAGPDLVAGAGEWVTLDARGSSDPDGDPLAFTWYQTGGPGVALVEGPPGTVRFLSPTTAALLGFEVVVGDGELESAAPVQVTVLPAIPNGPPVVDAGPDQQVARGTLVVLYGGGSDPDGDAVSLRWEQTGGPPVTLEDPGMPGAWFVAPGVSCELEFSLTGSDGVLSVADAVRVTVSNAPPTVTVSLAPDAPGTADDLTAVVEASDPDGDRVQLAFAWTRDGEPVGHAAATFPAAETAKGQRLGVIVTAFDGEASAAAEAAVVVQDSPPTLSADGPASVPWGGDVAFRVAVTDPDGDPPGPLVLLHGPAGMEVAADGAVTWTASLPMFDTRLDVRWAVGLAGAPGISVGGTIAVEDPARAYPLYRTTLAIPAFEAGLEAADLDGDGTTELLVASWTGLYELGRVPGGGYEQRWAYPFSLAGASTGVPPYGSAGLVTAVRDLDGDDRPELFASGADVVVLDGVRRREVARRQGSACVDLEIADVDLDGAPELVCLRWNAADGAVPAVEVLDAGTLALEWAVAGVVPGVSLAVGNVDSDPAPEIVLASGYVLDGVSHADEWVAPVPFGYRVDTGDLDGNGVEEIVGMGDWQWLRGYDAVRRTPLWEVAATDLEALRVLDLDADGIAEIVTGDGQAGSVRVRRYSPATNGLTDLHSMSVVDSGVTSLALGDLDGDGALEVAWGSGAKSSGGDTFVVASLAPAAVEWRTYRTAHLDGPYLGAREALIAPAARRPVFVTPTTDNSYGGPRLVELDRASGAVRVGPPVVSDRVDLATIDVADVDGDGLEEVVTFVSDFGQRYLAAADAVSGLIQWRSPALATSAVALGHGDLSGDGVDDVIALLWGEQVTAWDVEGNAPIWTSVGLGKAGDVAAADLDGDGVREVIALADGVLYVYGREPGGSTWFLQRAWAPAPGGTDLLVADCDGDGAPELYVLAPGEAASSVFRFDASLAEARSLPAPAGAAALHLEDLGFARKNLLLAVSTAVSTELQGVDALTGALVWRSPAFRGSAPRGSLSYVDEGRAIMFGTETGMYVTR